MGVIQRLHFTTVRFMDRVWTDRTKAWHLIRPENGRLDGFYKLFIKRIYYVVGSFDLRSWTHPHSSDHWHGTKHHDSITTHPPLGNQLPASVHWFTGTTFVLYRYLGLGVFNRPTWFVNSGDSECCLYSCLLLVPFNVSCDRGIVTGNDFKKKETTTPGFVNDDHWHGNEIGVETN